MLDITRDPIGQGRRRRCYVHPEDPRKAVLLAHNGGLASLKRSYGFYRQLKRQGVDTGPHIPVCYGACKTNLGPGLVVDLVRNYDGEISRSLSWYLDNGLNAGTFDACFDEFFEACAAQLVVFDETLDPERLLVKKLSTSSAHLVAVSGLGDLFWRRRVNWFPALQRHRLRRRWRDVMAAFYQRHHVTRGHG